MSTLLESPVLLVLLGLVPTVIAGVVYVQTSRTAALAAVGLLLLLTLGAVFLERWWVTPAEGARAAVNELFLQIKANDLPGVLRQIDPAADEIRVDAEVLMPMFQVLVATTGGEAQINLAPDKLSATAQLKPLIKVHHRNSGATGAYFDHLQVDLVVRDDRWLVSGYQAAQEWRDGATKLSR